MDIASATGEEAPIFTAAKRYPDPIFGHCDVSSAFLCRSPPRLIKSREFVAARERIVMSAANCCPKPGYGATSKRDGKSGSYTGEVNACGEPHEPSLGGSDALEHWLRCHEPDEAHPI